MAIKDSILPEFDHEMGTTRRLLERVPQAEFAWVPHHKSMSLGVLASHVADLPGLATLALDTAFLDINTSGRRPQAAPSTAELLKKFDTNVGAARKKIEEQTDASLLSMWTLKQGDHEIFTLPKVAVLRSFFMNHLIHHRGQLSVYLRLRDVPLPSIYGPTADEG